MRVSLFFSYLALAVSTAQAVSVPNSDAVDVRNEAISGRSSDILAPEHALEKRKGGGGKGGGGGSSGSKGGSSSGGSGARPGGSGAAAGAPRTFGGGSYYGGGAAQPFRSGRSTPKGLAAGAVLAPVLLIGLLPGIWLWSVYPYYFNNPYRFYNETAQNATNPNGTNQTLPVTCLCQEFNPCGCEENDDQTYLRDLVGNGSYDNLNQSLVNVADVNGTRTLVINGTLPNGTEELGTAMIRGTPRYAGYYALAMAVVYFCMFA